MRVPLLTVEQAMAAKPCKGYTEDRVRELGGEGKTPAELAKLDIPWADRWWALTQTGILEDNELRLIAARVARSALLAERKAGREPDERSWTAVNVAERFAKGKATKEELAAARAAAWAATWATAWAAAWAATWDAAWAAAWDAASAARAAWDAASDAARDAAYRRFFDIARRVLEPRGRWE